LRFEGILKIDLQGKRPPKVKKPANSITSAHPISQPTQGIQNSSRTTKYVETVVATELGFTSAAEATDRTVPFLLSDGAPDSFER
jgi:hypothetical protein